jgi:hypothetical protein
MAEDAAAVGEAGVAASVAGAAAAEGAAGEAGAAVAVAVVGEADVVAERARREIKSRATWHRPSSRWE